MHVTNTSNLPVEALENEYPLLVEEYGLVPGSGGAGRSRGGLGIARQIRVLEDGTAFGCRSDSHLTRAEGVFGGEPGAPGRLIRNPGRLDEQSLPSKVSRLVLSGGEWMQIETPGGGGAGPPEERDPTSSLRICAAERRRLVTAPALEKARPGCGGPEPGRHPVSGQRYRRETWRILRTQG